MNRRRLLEIGGGTYTTVEYVKCNGVCTISTGVTLGSAITSLETEFGIILRENVSSSHVIAISSPNSCVQIYTNGGRLYNQSAWCSLSRNVLYDVETLTQDRKRTFKVNGVTYSDTTTNRPFANSEGIEVVLFSTNSGTMPCTEVFKYFNIKVNGSYVRKYAFVKDSNSVIHLLDALTNTIYSNSGSGYFSEYNI